MIVDIEDGDATALPREPVRRDRGIVEIAVTAEDVGTGVMTRRAGEGERGALAFVHRARGRQGIVHRRARRRPGTAHDRRRRVETVRAERGFNVAVAMAALHAARGPRRRDRVRCVVTVELAPGGVRAFEELHETGIVYVEDRGVVECLGREDRSEFAGFERHAHILCTLRHFHRRRHASAFEFLSRAMFEMCRCVEGFHGGGSSTSAPHPKNSCAIFRPLPQGRGRSSPHLL